MLEPTRRRQLEAYLTASPDDLQAELALYDAASRGPAETWATVAGPVRGWLCVDWRWCQVRQDAHFENAYDLALAVVGILSAHLAEIPLHADELLIAALVVKLGLDRFCGCGEALSTD